MSRTPCKHCGVHRPQRMRGAQCYDCLNERRRTRYQHDPTHRLERTAQRDSGADPDKKRQRQAQYRERSRYMLRVPIHLPQHPHKELQPVILPDWFWYLLGRRVIGQQYTDAQVNPSSYDTLLADRIMLQRYRGVEYPNTRAVLELYPHDIVVMRWRDPVTGIRKTASLNEAPFQPGDSVLATTAERFRVPRFVRLQGMLKSSPAREGLDSRSALYVDPGFEGSVTLELHFDRSGYLIPGQPLVQFEAQLCLSTRAYSGHYVGQDSVTPNQNPTGIAFRSTVQ